MKTKRIIFQIMDIRRHREVQPDIVSGGVISQLFQVVLHFNEPRLIVAVDILVMRDQGSLAGLCQQAACSDPQRDREFTVSEEEIAAAGIEFFGVAQEVMHDNVRRVETGEFSKKPMDVAFRIVVAHAAIKHFDVLAADAQHFLDPRRYRLILRNPPSERDGAAEKQDASLGCDHGDRAAAQPPFVDADRNRLQHSRGVLDVVVPEKRIMAGSLEFLRVPLHFDVVILHRTVFDAQDPFREPNGQQRRNDQQNSGINGVLAHYRLCAQAQQTSGCR